jgi:integrase
MTPKAEYRVHFNRRKRTTSKDGRFPVEVEGYIPFSRERRYLPTSIRITPEQWYTGKKEDTYVNRKHPNYQNLNNRIGAILKQFNNVEQSYLEKGVPFHLEYLTFNQEKEKEQSFIQYWRQFIDNPPNKFSLGRIKGYKSTLRILKQFKSEILFFELDQKLLLDYEIFLLDYKVEKKGEEYSFKGNYIHNLFKDFQATVNRAIADRIIQPQHSPFLSFKFSHYKNMGDSEIKYLTPQEVKLLENLEISKANKHLIKTKDMFLLSCYTGLRFCDVSRLTREHLVDRTGSLAINVVQQKTGRPVNIPISKMFDRKPLHIVKAWMALGRQELFGDITNQYANRNLKILAEMAGIDKHVTFHMARHTSGTWLVSKRLPLITVRDILGHSSVTMTEKYAKLIPKDMEDQLEAIDY